MVLSLFPTLISLPHSRKLLAKEQFNWAPVSVTNWKSRLVALKFGAEISRWPDIIEPRSGWKCLFPSMAVEWTYFSIMRSIIYYLRVVKFYSQCPHKPPSSYENLHSDPRYQTLVTLGFHRVQLPALTGCWVCCFFFKHWAYCAKSLQKWMGLYTNEYNLLTVAATPSKHLYTYIVLSAMT